MVISDEVCALVQVDPEAFGLDDAPRLVSAPTGVILTELEARLEVGSWLAAEKVRELRQMLTGEQLAYRTTTDG